MNVVERAVVQDLFLSIYLSIYLVPWVLLHPLVSNAQIAFDFSRLIVFVNACYKCSVVLY